MDRRDQGEAAAEDKTYPLAILPDDVLADVLRRLPPRGLAVSRCVCKAWLAVVDARRLLRADLLPLSLGGLFINFHNYYLSEFFAPHSDGPCISGKHDYLPQADSWGYLDDHCNGLVLIHENDDNDGEIGYVLNPATRWVAPVPPCPPPPMEIKDTFQVEYLAYDPIESPYFEVVSITRFHWVRKPGDYLYDSSRDAEIEQSEWPPSLCILHVFSSRTGQWEERSFAREGDSIGTVSGMRHWPGDQRNAVYWRGALYVHCQTNYVMRISLSSEKYHVIKPPPGVEGKNYPQFYLGKSSKGVCCASIQGRCRVQVWNLDESGYQMEWVLKHDRDLFKWLLKHKLQYTGPWALQDINYYYNNRNRDHDMEAPAEEEIEWTSQASEDEKFTWSSDDECGHTGYVDILGFHPCKEIIFLSESITRGLAYHLDSSKVEVLGNIYPAGYDKELSNERLLESSFLYTPCWITQTADDGE
ncbi:putative F-box protein At1g46984 [Miscanthus floridulus]|uniref:putative F-box protein At1g46984 n=1 Tax=Miscanthus floridulus TaxID=154761 RepID=UPI0034576442